VAAVEDRRLSQPAPQSPPTPPSRKQKRNQRRNNRRKVKNDESHDSEIDGERLPPSASGSETEKSQNSDSRVRVKIGETQVRRYRPDQPVVDKKAESPKAKASPEKKKATPSPRRGALQVPKTGEAKAKAAAGGPRTVIRSPSPPLPKRTLPASLAISDEEGAEAVAAKSRQWKSWGGARKGSGKKGGKGQKKGKGKGKKKGKSKKGAKGKGQRKPTES
jgi:hypothetical protein